MMKNKIVRVDPIQMAQAYIELRKRSFHRFLKGTMPQFIDGWIYQDLCAKLEQFAKDVKDKKSPRLIVCMPPRHLKSQTCSVRFPAWALLQNPEWEVVIASYGQDLANKFSRWARSLIEYDSYVKTLWPNAKVSHDQGAVQEWKINNEKMLGGTYKAVGKGGGLTGSGCEILVCDDTLKDAEEADSYRVREALWDWYTSVALTRLAPGGGILIIQTRWHPDDLVGRVLREAKENQTGDQWQVVEYKAIAEQDEEFRKAGEALLPQRFSVEHFEKLKATMPPRWWEALYQQRPMAQGGNLFKEENFRRYLAAPTEFEHLIQVWDLRFGKSQTSGSFVVGWVIGKKEANYYILDEVRGRWSYAESRAELIKLSEKWPNAIAKVIENKANGPAIESDLEGQISGIILYNPQGDKFQRAERVLPLVLAGNVYFPDDSVVPWAKDAIFELCAFPRGANDDRVDVLSMGLSWYIDQQQYSCEVFVL